ncbi:MAG: hypothetical protein EHM47_16030 [Ignavibacteriales bacterium]|nr:MAG: hypothetical protein EHM47_16030 [Ignavibacteriales bacterium]
MKIKLIVILLIASGLSFPWGEEGHKLIAGKAIDLLIEKIPGLDNYKDYITEHSIDPDVRRNLDDTEFPKHFIDIDFYEEFLDGRMIYDKQQLTALYGDSVITKMGILPWATLQTFNNLQKAFTEHNRDKVLIYAADLAHYVADAHQPMHTMLNYDGKLTDQKGIHGRYESEMIERYFDELEGNVNGNFVGQIDDPLTYIFSYIENSNSLGEALLAADIFADKRTGSTDNDNYYRLLWFKTKYVTEIQFESAVNSLASLIFAAWSEAGEPSLTEIN